MLQSFRDRLAASLGFLPKLLNEAPNLRGAIDTVDDYALERAIQARAIQAPQAVQQLGKRLKLTVDREKFVAGTWRANEFSVIGYYPGSRNVVVELLQGAAYKLYIKALAKKAGANGSAGSQTITCPSLVQTRRKQPTLPATYHPDVKVMCQTAGGWNLATITAINFTTGVVTYNEPANCTNVEAHYTHSDGEFRFRLQRELGGSDISASTILNGSIAGLHLVDQNNRDTNFVWPSLTPITSGYRLTLEVKSALEHTFQSRADHTIIIPAESYLLETNDITALRDAVERTARGR
jgi:hypothetical protein